MPVLKNGVFKDPPKFKSSLPGDNPKTKRDSQTVRSETETLESVVDNHCENKE